MPTRGGGGGGADGGGGGGADGGGCDCWVFFVNEVKFEIYWEGGGVGGVN